MIPVIRLELKLGIPIGEYQHTTCLYLNMIRDIVLITYKH